MKKELASHIALTSHSSVEDNSFFHEEQEGMHVQQQHL